MPAAPGLVEQAVRGFNENGWVFVPGFFSPPEASDLQRCAAELAALPERPGAQMVYHETSRRDPAARLIQRIEDFCGYHRELDALIRGRLQRAAGTLLGEAALLFKEKINYKMAGGAGFEPHQDQQAGWSGYAPLFVTALVSIDATTLENGCLEVAAGARRTALVGAEWIPLDPGQLQGVRFLPVATVPGDVLFFDSFVIHASAPNHTDSARRVLYVTYNGASHGDHRTRYYADKRAAFPPDIDRQPGVEYRYRV